MSPIRPPGPDAIPPMPQYERRFALFVMVAGALSSGVLIATVLLGGQGLGVLPGVTFGALGCVVALGLAALDHLGTAVRVQLWACAIGVWPATAMEPSGEGALAAALTWLLLGVFASLLLPASEMAVYGVACSLGCLTLVGWIGHLGVSPTLHPAGTVAVIFVATGFVTLGLIASYFRASLQRIGDAERVAREALEARGQFLANMSHELRTPLNAILGYSEMLQEDANCNPTSVADLRRIHRAGSTLLAHINALLDLSKLEAGRTAVFPEPVDLEELAANLVADQRTLFAERGNEVVIELEPGLSVVTDPGKLNQILTNLMSNANKFTENGKITLVGRRDGDAVWVAIHDTGIGIPPSAIEHIFQPFTQADPSTTRTYGGTGLGLALVREVAELLGGSAEAESVEGVGSTFRVWLPDARADRGPN